MGTDDLFNKRREARKQRQHEIKMPKANSYLIVTEGKCTEPNYFRGLKELISERVGGTVDVVGLPAIDIYGEGSSTGKLIEITEQLVKEAKLLYQNIWVVFDKDDFEDFNQAIQKGLDKGIYQKNYQDIYQMVNCNDGVNTAIKSAKRRMAGFNGKQKPSEYDPGTMVYKLVEELKSYLDE